MKKIMNRKIIKKLVHHVIQNKMSIKGKLLVFDQDGVMWQGNSSVHDCEVPFKRISEKEIESANGIRITLISGIKSLIEECYHTGKILTIPKYNLEKTNIEALKKFDLFKYFSFPVMQWNSKKNKFQKMLTIDGEQRFFEQEEIVFVEDRGAIKHLFREYEIETDES